ncbi:hypothetical protein AV530_014755 [Patagioenas fasciata monilis]|uniref:Uncharacterized protein n=1 Tax=Patagioenas fasciata monilis TaxID=372326 RepID=A0A1V4L0B2_PATFA|nr:hypothetical protein AV530_014755 [Patagioenas fasciata monilis]
MLPIVLLVRWPAFRSSVELCIQRRASRDAAMDLQTVNATAVMHLMDFQEQEDHAGGLKACVESGTFMVQTSFQHSPTQRDDETS